MCNIIPGMPSMNEIVGGTTGVRVTESDHELSEKLDVDHKAPSTVLTDSLEKWDKFDDLREEKKQELKSKIMDVREEADKWDIDMEEIYI